MEKKIDSFAKGLENFKSLYATIAALLAPLIVTFNLALGLKSKKIPISIKLWLHDPIFVWLITSAIVLLLSLIFLLIDKKALPIQIGFKRDNPPQHESTPSKTPSINTLFFSLSLITFTLALCFYSKSQFSSSKDFGIIGFKFNDSGLDQTLRLNLNFHVPEGEFKYLGDYSEEEIEDQETRRIIFKGYYSNGLMFHGMFASSSITCFVEWIGEYDKKCIDIATTDSFVTEKLYLENYSFKLDSAARILSDFLLGYKCLHYCDKIDSARYYFGAILNDPQLKKKIETTPPNSYLKLFFEDVKKFDFFAEKIKKSHSTYIPTTNIVFPKTDSSISQTDTIQKLKLDTMKIGDSYEGGIIFDLDSTRKHGLIAAQIDLGTAIFARGTINDTLKFFNMEKGDSNTYNLEKFNRSSVVDPLTYKLLGPAILNTFAAVLSRSYRGGNQNDWYLPAINQLQKLYLQRSLIKTLGKKRYWSSTANGNNASYFDFETGKMNLDSLSAKYTVRPIRSF